MGEVINDVLVPQELILPEMTGVTQPNPTNMSGASIYLSGSKLYFNRGNGLTDTITSATA